MNDCILMPCDLGLMSLRDFDKIRKLAYDYCGLNIESGKEDLVASRLGKIMRQRGISSYRAYYDYVVADRTSQALVTMIDSLTTNHTSFFREQQHFDFLASTIFPALAGRTQIDIWSAACSTGEEPYSLAFAAREFFDSAGPNIHILATDISTRVLEVARQATYEEQRFQSLPNNILQRYLLRGTGVASGFYRIRPEICATVQFQRLNLMESFHRLNTIYPLILCRNAMIYFDAATQEQLVERFYQQIEPGGYLFIGHSESLGRIVHRFEYICPAVYRKPGVLKGAPVRRGDTT